MVISLMDWLWKIAWFTFWLELMAADYQDDKRIGRKTNYILFLLGWLPIGALLLMLAFMPDFFVAINRR